MRRLFAIAIALTLLTACGGDGASVSQTDIKSFLPWKEDGTATLVKVKNEIPGACFGASGKVDGAFRCFVGAEIQDPCFVPAKIPNAGRVACAADPWSDVTIVTLTAPLPHVVPPVVINPHWAIELENHDRCVSLVTSAATTANGVTMPYTCRSRSTAGELDKNTQPWTVQYNRNNISFDLTPLKVASAW